MEVSPPEELLDRFQKNRSLFFEKDEPNLFRKTKSGFQFSPDPVTLFAMFKRFDVRKATKRQTEREIQQTEFLQFPPLRPRFP